MVSIMVVSSIPTSPTQTHLKWHLETAFRTSVCPNNGWRGECSWHYFCKFVWWCYSCDKKKKKI